MTAAAAHALFERVVAQQFAHRLECRTLRFVSRQDGMRLLEPVLSAGSSARVD